MKNILIVILLVIAAGLGGLAYTRVRQAWPQTSGTLQLSGLQQPVTVIRDRRGVPHIYAQNSRDLFMAQGFVQAQDRFWQMELSRRIGQGRLAELFGAQAVPADKFLLSLGIVEAAQLTWDQCAPETRQVLGDFAAGVNAYLQQQGDRLPLEFQLLALTGASVQPEPWTPLDSIGWGTVASLALASNYQRELGAAQRLARLGETRAAELQRLYPADHPLIVPPGVAWWDQAPAWATALPGSLTQANGFGSNNWVISGKKSTTGRPILANDPHLPNLIPSIWYEVGLHCQQVSEACPYDVVGFSFAFAPAVVVGHNARIAWGVTNLPADVQDLYVEKIHPDNPNQYEVNGQWMDMTLRYYEIKVAGQKESVPFVVRLTRHGAIVNDVVTGLGEWGYGWQPVALKWTALDANDLLISLLQINRAQDWPQFRAALSHWNSPAQNFIYADIDGNIGYQAAGRIPIRAQGKSLTPVPGWTDDYEWVGTIPFDELPSSFNPPQEFIVTANNKVTSDNYPYLLSVEWDDGYRARRIVEMLQAKDKLNLADVQAMQADNANLFARDVLPVLKDVPLDRPEVAQARDQLLQWDTQQGLNSSEAVLFEAFYMRLSELLFKDVLGTTLGRTIAGHKSLVRDIVLNAQSSWWDNPMTPRKETREQVLSRALNQAYDLAVQLQGRDMNRWRWGAVHRTTFGLQVTVLQAQPTSMGAGSPLSNPGLWLAGQILNRGPVETAGGHATVNDTSWGAVDPQDPFAVVWMPTMRMIVDLADLDRSVAINSTGQSGHPYHPHYDDQIENWRLVRYAPMYWSRDRLEQNSEGSLSLTP